MNFLELAQELASESGTVNNPTAQLTTVTGQSGRLKKIVGWVNSAYQMIQMARSDWRWMQGEFLGETVAGAGRYEPNGGLIGSRFGSWNVCGLEENRFSIFKTSDGAAQEGALRFLDWETFYTTQLRGARPAGKPVFFSISPANEFCLSPVPDGAYTVRGPYQKGPQRLVLDGDVPEMPDRFHPLIVDVGLEFLEKSDEAAFQIPLTRLRKLQRWGKLEEAQLPPMTLAGALA